MGTIAINGDLFKEMIINGHLKLKKNMDRINDLNVFPVPDGDTGSNMSATILAGVTSIKNSDETSVGALAKKLSRGMLMGARGNSGVILSQLFSGFAKGLDGHVEADMLTFSMALRQGVEQAYSSVINPVEGTILTVAREGADEAISVAEDADDFEDLFELYIKEMERSLENTPELLAVLKEVGVVDSGAAGFLEIVRGMDMALHGTMLDDAKEEPKKNSGNGDALHKAGTNNHITFSYCTEFIMQIEKMDEFNQQDFIEMISPLGDSLVVVQDENILKVHIHTNTPGDALNLAQHFGYFVNLKIENMRVQHSEVMLHHADDEHLDDGCGHDHTHSHAPKIRRKYALIAVANGDGLIKTFKDMGCDEVIAGGQTMNPSTEDFVEAINAVNADHIILIPNNKNIIMSAEAATEVCEDLDIHILPTKTIAEGYAALTMFDATMDVDENLSDMEEHLETVKSGEVTYAIRDSKNNGFDIKKGDFMGLINGELKVVEHDRIAVLKTMIELMVDDRSEIMTLMIGKDVKDNELAKLESSIISEFDVELEKIEGDQDIYSFIIAVE